MSHLVLLHRYHSVRSTPATFVKRSPTTTMAHTDVTSLQITIAVLVVFIIVAGLPIILGYVWILYRRRTTQHQRDGIRRSIGLVIVDSNVGIDVHYSPCAGDVEAARDVERRYSTETIVSPVSLGQTLVEPYHQPARSTPLPRDNILDRRGRTRLNCDTRARHFIDGVLTPPMVESCPVNKIQITPKFGFDEASITPPVGSPLWKRQPDSAGVPDSPRRIMRHHVSQGPFTSFAY